MKFRVLIAASVMLLAAACGSNSTGGSGSTGATAGNLATAPPTSDVTLSETGSNNLYPLMSSWAGIFHSRYPNVTINTQSALSGVGIAQAAAGAVNIGASDAYLSDADIAAHQGLMNIAMAVSSVHVHYNLPGVTGHLKLNGKVLAAMYQGTIKSWDDPQIVAINPEVELPAIPVVPLHRSDGQSSDTLLFTQYLAKQDPDGWGKSPGSGTTVSFPAVPNAVGAAGQSGVLGGCVKSPGCVAYIGTRYYDDAMEKGLGDAQLGNASGNFVLANAQSVDTAASGFISQTPANQAISLVNGPVSDGYPIVGYEYAVVYSKQKDPAVAQTIRAFLHWAVTAGSSPRYLRRPHLYAQPLPGAVAKLSDAQIATISS